MKFGGLLVVAAVLGFSGACDAATTHTYDSLNRLTGVDYGNGTTITYSYDAAGNRLSRIVAVIVDSTPDAFSFTPLSDWPLGTQATSNSITVAGANSAAPISVSGGEYAVDGGAWTATPGTINAGHTAQLRVTSSANHSTVVSAILTIGGVAGTFVVTTVAPSQTASATALTSSVNPSTLGQAVTFTATVIGNAPTGTVTFNDGAPVLCNAVPLAGGQAQCMTTALAIGGHGITAAYSGDALNASSTSTVLDQTVNLTSSSTSLATSGSPSAANQSITLTATVTGIGPGGTVGFKKGAAHISGCSAVALTGSGNSRTAQCATGPLTAGGYLFIATFNGDAINAPSAGAVGQTVTIVPGFACAGFTDVDSGNVFCPNIDWVTNRKVPPDCGGGLYCPIGNVTRYQMAAFLHGLGNAMTPIRIVRQAITGAIVLDDDPVVCQTADTLVADFPRRAELDAVFMGKSTADVGFAVEPVASFDNGASWWPLVVNAGHALVEANHWGNLRVAGYQDVEVGQTVRFGLQVRRDGQPGSANLTDSRCNLRALLQNRNGTFSPF